VEAFVYNIAINLFIKGGLLVRPVADSCRAAASSVRDRTSVSRARYSRLATDVKEIYCLAIIYLRHSS